MSQSATAGGGNVTAAHAARLFGASCIALTCGAAMFAVTGDIATALKRDFVLSNEQMGILMGWPGWGFPLGLFAFGPLCDAIGMRRVLRLAVVFHAAGILMMVFADGFGMLFAGATVNALGSGAVEAACNPLIATIYPDKKTHKLNQFHMWFPGGIVIGGVACYLINLVSPGWWQLKLAICVVPVAVYGVMFTGQYFPPTERVASGVSFGGMFRETLLRPLFLVLLFTMMLTASIELGPNRWVPAVLQAGGIPGILVLVWITGLMAVLRFVAGPVVKWFGSNSLLLLVSAVVAGVGLTALSFATNVYIAGVAATVFALGVCYFWPTILGTVAERFPKGGALALALMGGAGGIFVSGVTVPVMGLVADEYLHQELVFEGTVDGRPVDRQAETVAVLRDVRTAYAAWSAFLGTSPQEEVAKADIRAALGEVDAVLAAFDRAERLPEGATANALRSVIKAGPATAPAERVEAISEGRPQTLDEMRADMRLRTEAHAFDAKSRAEAILNPADNKGGLMSFRWVALLALVPIAVFGVMYLQDRRRSRQPPMPAGQ
jgi:MFS family permease